MAYNREYNIAGFRIALMFHSPKVETLLAAMSPFAFLPNKAKEQPLVCRIEIYDCPPNIGTPPCDKREEYISDLGQVQVYTHSNDGYAIIISYSEEVAAISETNHDFSYARVHLNIKGQFAAKLLTSTIRIIFSQAITAHQAIALHASCVVNNGQAYAFVGASGAGKSTHSNMWLKAINGSWLLNDDCVILRFYPDEHQTKAWGSPWSGKRPYYINSGAPLAAITRIRKAASNHFVPLTEIDGFNTVLPGCSALRSRGPFFSNICDTLLSIISNTTVGDLYCIPAPEAAATCLSSIIRQTTLHQI